MKQTTINLLLLLPLLWLAGCSNEDDAGLQPEIRPGNEVLFNIGFAPSTRASTDAAFNTVFEDGDEIGVFAMKEGTTAAIAQNVKLVRISGNWTAATDADKIYYPLDGSKLDFYVYYPYQGDYNTTIDGLSFEVQTDQSTASGYSKSDLLSATAISQNFNLVTLSFNHLMAMVQVTADKVAPVPAFRDGTDGFRVILKNVKRETTALNWTSNSASVNPSASATDITMYRVPTTDGSWVFRALVPSQQIAAGKMFAFGQTLQGNVIDMGYSISAPLTPAPTKASTYKVTLDYQLDPNHVYNVGDVYPYKGTPVGIVYEISNGGKNGKIMSLDEGMLQWGPNAQTNATSSSDGLANMKTVFEHNSNSFTNYPIFSWVNTKNPAGTTYASGTTKIWYIPSMNELFTLHDQCYTNYTTFNNQLISAGGKKIENSNWPYYWSSTETSSVNSIIIQFFGAYGPYSKTSNSRARAIMAF